jgi:hypothetical protein
LRTIPRKREDDVSTQVESDSRWEVSSDEAEKKKAKKHKSKK